MGKSPHEQFLNEISTNYPFPERGKKKYREAHAGAIKVIKAHVENKYKKLTPAERKEMAEVYAEIKKIKEKADSKLGKVRTSERYENYFRFDAQENREIEVTGPNSLARKAVEEANLSDDQIAHLS